MHLRVLHFFLLKTFPQIYFNPELHTERFLVADFFLPLPPIGRGVVVTAGAVPAMPIQTEEIVFHREA